MGTSQHKRQKALLVIPRGLRHSHRRARQQSEGRCHRPAEGYERRDGLGEQSEYPQSTPQTVYGALIRMYSRLLTAADRQASSRAMVFTTYFSSAIPFSSHPL